MNYREETLDKSPYLRLRAGRVLAVYADKGVDTTPSEATVLGAVQLEWIDRAGKRDLVPIMFPSFSNPVTMDGPENDTFTASVGKCYGDISLPSVGDIALVMFRGPAAPVVIGYLPVNYLQQTSKDDKPEAFGTMRRIRSGEFSRLSGQQAEIYQDRAGAVQIIVKAQPTASSPLVDGSGTGSVDDIDPKQIPKAELARIVVGEAYADETFATRAVGVSGKKIILVAKMASGAFFQVDTDGNVELSAAPGKQTTINGAPIDGSKGLARMGDTVQTASADGADSKSVFLLLQTLVTALTASATVPLDGGAAYKAAITAALSAAGFSSAASVPTTMTGKVTTASKTVSAAD